MRRIRNIFLSVFTLILVAVPTLAQTPPKGDNAAAPVNVALNARKTVHNIQYATMEGAAVETVSCDAGNSSDHSVWFRFTMPEGGAVDIDAGGSIINGASGSHAYVALSLHREDAGLTEVGCIISSTARLVNQPLVAGGYVVRLANASINTPTGPSQYRISLRARYLSGLLDDPSFENQPLGVTWKAKRAGDPPKVTRVCSSSCVIRFGGVADGRVVQSVVFDRKVLRFKAGDVVSADGFINNTGVAGANVRLMLKITYTDGHPVTKVTATRLIVQTGTGATISFGGLYAEIASEAVGKIQLTVISPTAAETFSLEAATVNLQAGSSARDLLLPVPPAP